MNRLRTLRRLRTAAVVLAVVALVFVVVSYYVPARPTDSVSVTAQYSHKSAQEAAGFQPMRTMRRNAPPPAGGEYTSH